MQIGFQPSAIGKDIEVDGHGLGFLGRLRDNHSLQVMRLSVVREAE